MYIENAACIDDPPDRLRRDVLTVFPELFQEIWKPLPGGRSNAVWHVGSVVVKRFLPAKATPLFPNDPELEAKALEHLSNFQIAPRLLAKGPGWVVWRHCSGRSWQGEAGLAGLFEKLQMVPRFAGLKARPMGAEAILADAKGFAPAACRHRLCQGRSLCLSPVCCMAILCRGIFWRQTVVCD